MISITVVFNLTLTCFEVVRITVLLSYQHCFNIGSNSGTVLSSSEIIFSKSCTVLVAVKLCLVKVVLS